MIAFRFGSYMSSNHNHIIIQYIHSLSDSSLKLQYFAFYNYITRCNLTDIFVCKFKPNYKYYLVTYLYVYILITNYNYTRLSYGNMRKLSKFLFTFIFFGRFVC